MQGVRVFKKQMQRAGLYQQRQPAKLSPPLLDRSASRPTSDGVTQQAVDTEQFENHFLLQPIDKTQLQVNESENLTNTTCLKFSKDHLHSPIDTQSFLQSSPLSHAKGTFQQGQGQASGAYDHAHQLLAESDFHTSGEHLDKNLRDVNGKVIVYQQDTGHNSRQYPRFLTHGSKPNQMHKYPKAQKQKVPGKRDKNEVDEINEHKGTVKTMLVPPSSDPVSQFINNNVLDVRQKIPKIECIQKAKREQGAGDPPSKGKKKSTLSLEFQNLKKRIRTSKAEGTGTLTQARITHFIPTSAKASPKDDYVPSSASEALGGRGRFQDRALKDRVGQAIVAGEKRVQPCSQKSSYEYGGRFDTLNLDRAGEPARQSDTINVKQYLDSQKFNTFMNEQQLVDGKPVHRSPNTPGHKPSPGRSDRIRYESGLSQLSKMSKLSADQTDLTVQQANTTVLHDNDDLPTTGTFDYVALKNQEFLRPDAAPSGAFDNMNELTMNNRKYMKTPSQIGRNPGGLRNSMKSSALAHAGRAGALQRGKSAQVTGKRGRRGAQGGHTQFQAGSNDYIASDEGNVGSNRGGTSQLPKTKSSQRVQSNQTTLNVTDGNYPNYLQNNVNVPLSLIRETFGGKRAALSSKSHGGPSRFGSRQVSTMAGPQGRDVGMALKLSNKRQIQAVLDSNNEINARFKLITHHNGQQSIQGTINSSVLSKHDRTLVMASPQASYYMHYERPVNKQMFRAATKELLHGETQKHQQIAPEIRCIDLKEKYQEQLQQYQAYIQTQFSEFSSINMRSASVGQSSRREEPQGGNSWFNNYAAQSQFKVSERANLAGRFERIARQLKKVSGKILNKQMQQNQGKMCFSDPAEQTNRLSPELLMIRSENNQSHIKLKMKNSKGRQSPGEPSGQRVETESKESADEEGSAGGEREDYNSSGLNIVEGSQHRMLKSKRKSQEVRKDGEPSHDYQEGPGSRPQGESKQQNHSVSHHETGSQDPQDTDGMGLTLPMGLGKQRLDAKYQGSQERLANRSGSRGAFERPKRTGIRRPSQKSFQLEIKSLGSGGIQQPPTIVDEIFVFPDNYKFHDDQGAEIFAKLSQHHAQLLRDAQEIGMNDELKDELNELEDQIRQLEADTPNGGQYNHLIRLQQREAQNSVHLKIEAFDKNKIIQPRQFEKCKLSCDAVKEADRQRVIQESLKNYILRESTKCVKDAQVHNSQTSSVDGLRPKEHASLAFNSTHLIGSNGAQPHPAASETQKGANSSVRKISQPNLQNFGASNEFPSATGLISQSNGDRQLSQQFGIISISSKNKIKSFEHAEGMIRAPPEAGEGSVSPQNINMVSFRPEDTNLNTSPSHSAGRGGKAQQEARLQQNFEEFNKLCETFNQEELSNTIIAGGTNGEDESTTRRQFSHNSRDGKLRTLSPDRETRGDPGTECISPTLEKRVISSEIPRVDDLNNDFDSGAARRVPVMQQLWTGGTRRHFIQQEPFDITGPSPNMTQQIALNVLRNMKTQNTKKKQVYTLTRTMRQKSLESRCQQRFKLLGFRTKQDKKNEHINPDDLLNQNILVSPPGAPKMRQNFAQARRMSSRQQSGPPMALAAQTPKNLAGTKLASQRHNGLRIRV